MYYCKAAITHLGISICYFQCRLLIKSVIVIYENLFVKYLFVKSRSYFETVAVYVT